MSKRLHRTIEYICLWLPFAALLVKNVILQGYMAGNNPYALNVWNGVTAVAPYLLWQAAVLSLCAAPMFLFKHRGRYRYGFVFNVIATVVLAIDITYYRCYNTVPSSSMLSVAFSEAGGATIVSTITSLFVWTDVLLIVDWAIWGILMAWLRRMPITDAQPRIRRPLISVWCAGVSAAVLLIVPLLSLFSADGGWARRMWVTADLNSQSRYFSSAGAHLIDAAQTVFTDTTTGTFTKEDEELYNRYFEWKNRDALRSGYTGAFFGKNLLIIQVESLESFVIGQTLNGQSVTPTIDRLADGGYYFPHIYEQVKNGNSSDCDFTLMTGLLPTYKGYAFGSYADRRYVSLQTVLKQEGNYRSYYFHGAANATWNYEEMLKQALGADRLVMDYRQDGNLNGYLADESFVKQTIEKITDTPLETPFYAHLVTCSSHIPCDVPADFDGLRMSEELAKHPMGRYLQSLHYTDRQLGVLLEALDQQGVLDNTVVAIVGDHGGVHKYYPHHINSMNDNIYESWFEKGGEYTVPFILYSKDIIEPRQFDVIGGQVDIMPTLLNVLGVGEEATKTVLLGRDLFGTSRNFAMRDEGVLYGTISEEDRAIAQTMFYLSDRMIRCERTGSR